MNPTAHVLATPVDAKTTENGIGFLNQMQPSHRHHCRRAKRFCATWIFAALMAGLASWAGADETKKPNFIIIFCDNLGYGDIEPFGSTLHRTPSLNRMAQEGRKFTHFCVTAGVCTPSRASIMTGCYAQRVGMHFNQRDGHVLRPVSPYGLHPDEVTIAEVLKAEGYATAIVGKWHLGDQPEFLPTRQGFDWFFGVPYSDDMTERDWNDGTHWPPLPLMENETVIEAPCDRDGLTKRYTERAMEWIAEHKDDPFFLYFPQAMPGSTSTPFSSEAFRGKSNNGPWGDSIEELDWSMGVMLDQLVELGIAENTFVIWTSDNGAPINRDPADLSRGSNLPLFGRGYTTAEGAFRVPTIVWQPGKVPAGTVCEELATTMDLLPTFAKLAGSQPPTDRKIDGHDIAPLFFGDENAKTPYEAFYYYSQQELHAVRSGPWKLFLPVPSARHPHFSKTLPPQNLLFNVVEDISCENNVADQHPEVVARLTALAKQARVDLGDRGQAGVGQRPAGRIPEGTSAQPQIMQKSALDLIEGGRGGRHWVDAETEPAKSPEESLAAIQIEPGYEIELFAAEPLVKDPVSMAFDREGRMYVVEYGDYPIGPPEGEAPLSKIILLEDTSGDGKPDQRHVFADSLDFAHSIMAYQAGLLVGAKTKILYLEDTNGDHVADVRVTLFDGFTPAHPQMQIGNPHWGIDNWVYLNFGLGEITSAKDPRTAVTMPRKDFRFHPLTMQFEADSGLGQFGNTIDRWGRRFYCSNRNPIMTTLLAPEVIARNPFHIVSAGHYDVGKAGGDTVVFPLVAMKSNHLSHAGTHTSACGTTAYTGDLGDDGFRNSVFVCEPIGHLVTRSIITSDGVRLKAERAEPKRDFIASTDTWFRPSNLATGPDGGLYLADMYRQWVEHPRFLPPDIAAQLDWRAGDDRGRIYRIVPKSAQVRPFVPPQSADDYVDLLADPNGWRQFLGQRLLVESQATEAASAVRALLNHDNPQVRLHALWTLDGIGLLQSTDVKAMLTDPNPIVRIDAIKLARRSLADADTFAAVLSSANHDDARVRFEVALTLSGSESEEATRVLAEIALRDGGDPMFANGLLTSTAYRSGAILRRLVESEAFLSRGDQDQMSLVKRLASAIGARGDIDELNGLFALLAATDGGKHPQVSQQQVSHHGNATESQWWRASVISGLGDGLPRYRGELGKLSLAALIADPPAALAESVTHVKLVLDQQQQIAQDPSRSVADRSAAVELLAFQPISQSADAFRMFLASDQPVEVQKSCVSAMGKNGSTVVAEIILERWSELGPAIRGPALGLLLRRVESTRLALDAMAAGNMNASALSIDDRVRLLKHSDDQIRSQSNQLFGGAVSTNRLQVAKEYEQALRLTGTVHEGQKVFTRICAACHRIDGQGHEAGPDLSDVRNRSKAALLYDILDPNSKVEPQYTSYSVLTHDGQVFNGLITSESSEAVVLTMAEGKQQTIGRAEIDQIKISDVSLMPEGIEKDVTVQQMADLLEFLKARG